MAHGSVSVCPLTTKLHLRFCVFYALINPHPVDIAPIHAVIFAGGGVLLPEARRPPQLRCCKRRWAKGLQLEHTQ